MEPQDDLDIGTAHDNEGGERPNIVTGSYIVTCVGMADGGVSKFPRRDRDDNPVFDRDGNEIYPERWKWELSVDEVDSKRPTAEQNALVGQVIWHWTNKGMGPKSYTRAFVEAFAGRPIHAGEQAKRSWVMNRKAVASIVGAEGRIKTISLSPFTGMESDHLVPDEPLGQTTKPAALPDSRDRIMDDMYEVDDRSQLLDIRTRINALRLDTDDEVVDVYNLTFARVTGGAEAVAAQGNVRQKRLS
jgi:hypothetical protein